jgi:hypothetical protein
MEKTFKICKVHDRGNDYDFWLQKSPQERIDATELLRENLIQLKYNVRPGFQKVYTVIERKKS